MKLDNPPPKLNIFALPNQVAILVVLLACVVYGTLIAIGATVQPVIFWLLALGLLVLSLRGLLSWPERECARNKLAPSGEEFAPVQALIARLACDLKLPRAPRLMLSQGDDLRIFGSWRRWYIAMGEGRAGDVLEMLHDGTTASQVEAAILHELCHFKHGDHSWTEYARALLRASLWLMVWATVMLVGILGLLSLAQRAFFENHSPAQVAGRLDAILPGTGQLLTPLLFGSTEGWQRAREQAAMIDLGQMIFNYFMNTFPLVLFGAGLLLVFWQQLMRTREIYADAGVARAQGRIGPLLGAPAALGDTIPIPSGAMSARPSLLQALGEQAWMYWRRLRAWLVRHHLGFEERVAYLHEPQLIYGGWRRNALLIGFFTLVLDLTFLGTSALFYVGEWPLHFAILAAYILIVLALLTPIAMGQPVWRDGLKIAAIVTIIRFVLLLVSLTILIVSFVLFPDLLARLIDVWTHGLAGFAVVSSSFRGDRVY